MTAHHLVTAKDTLELGEQFGKELQPNKVVCFFGNLGAGKTTFIKGIAKSLGIDPTSVNSPTFQYLNIYKGTLPVFHFDLYRLGNLEDFLSLGFEEMFSQGGISCIEWSERIESIIPEDAIFISIDHTACGGRKIEIQQ